MRIHKRLAVAAVAAAALLYTAWARPPGRPPAHPAARPAATLPLPVNLLANPRLEEPIDRKTPNGFHLEGDVEWTLSGDQRFEFTSHSLALHSGRDLDGDGRRAGRIWQRIAGLDAARSRWYRFTFHGLPQSGFAVAQDDLQVRIDFHVGARTDPVEYVVKRLYAAIETSRKDLGGNGRFGVHGAAAWLPFSLEFMLPFNEVDAVTVSVAFGHGQGTQKGQHSFLIDDLELTAIAAPEQYRPAPPRPDDVERRLTETGGELVPLGGRWFALKLPGESEAPRTFDAANADRLVYNDGRYRNPFAGNMTSWKQPGFLDSQGKMVDKAEFVRDSVVISVRPDALIVHSRGLPNHPTARFPDRERGIDSNPNYVQEQDDAWTIPLFPQINPDRVAMDRANSNRALPGGPIGLAVNGVVFFNPFDADGQVAVDIMDRCCGHPAPDYRYHYHKYPICVKSPWTDTGADHSPIIGFAFDGFPIYGPYESAGVMARDLGAGDNPLNAFNCHYDEERGWHYHVTPGRFPFVIGGYFGVAALESGPPGGHEPRGGGHGMGPPRGRRDPPPGKKGHDLPW